MRRRQKAQIVVIAPIALLLFVAISGMVVDLALIGLLRSEMQNAADAAALAAIWYYPNCPYLGDPCAPDNTNTGDPASVVAQKYASAYNGVLVKSLCGSAPVPQLQPDDLNTPPVPALTVVMVCNPPWVGTGLLGLAPGPVWVTSTAAIGNVDANGNLTDFQPTGPYLTRLVP